MDYIFKKIFIFNFRSIRGGSRDFGKGAVDQKADFKLYAEAIKNALKWRKLDISSFVSKKVVIFSTKHYINLKCTNYILFYIE